MCGGPEILLLAGTMLSATSAIAQGNIASRQATLQAGVMQQQATHERQIAAVNESDFRRRQERAMGAVRAAKGASGVDTSTGSPLLTSQDFAGEVELQARRIRAGGDIRATRLEQQAELTRFGGRAERRAGLFRAGSLLLTGAGKAFA